MTLSRKHVTKARPDKASIDFKTDFHYGRTTALHCHGSAHILPNPEDGCAANKRVFVDNLQLTWRETTALMGVHTLGRAQIKHSGYRGWWSNVENQRRFNNNYYFAIAHKGWMAEIAIQGNPNKNQWVRSDLRVLKTDAMHHEMMLDTDMCLFYNKQTKGNNWGESTRAANCGDGCTWWGDGLSKICGKGDDNEQRETCCAHAPPEAEKFTGKDCGSFNRGGTAGADVMEFANNEGAWLETFKTAWYKVTEIGFDNLKPLECNAL